MKTVKFNEGKKSETSFDFDDDEVIMFGPVENTTYRFNDEGCLMGCLTIATLFIIRIFIPIKKWTAEFILTNKRLVTIPLPPNKKKYPAESFYFKDISKAKVVKPQDPKQGEISSAHFGLVMKPGVKLPVKGSPQFWVWAKINAKYFANMAKQLGREIGAAVTDMANEAGAGAQTKLNYDAAVRDKQKYYQVVTAAKTKLEAMDTSDAGHVQIRDFFVDMINECVSIVNS